MYGMIYLLEHLTSIGRWSLNAETNITPYWSLILVLSETDICQMALAPNASWAFQKAREIVPNLRAAHWRPSLLWQNRWRYQLHHVLKSEPVPLVQYVQVWSDTLLPESKWQKTRQKQKFPTDWSSLRELVQRTIFLSKKVYKLLIPVHIQVLPTY